MAALGDGPHVIDSIKIDVKKYVAREVTVSRKYWRIGLDLDPFFGRIVSDRRSFFPRGSWLDCRSKKSRIGSKRIGFFPDPFFGKYHIVGGRKFKSITDKTSNVENVNFSQAWNTVLVIYYLWLKKKNLLRGS